MFGQVGPWQLVLILAVVFLVFGSKRLPDTARALGKSMRILKSEASALKKESDGPSVSDAASQAAADPSPPKTIQAAPGDVSSSRPVEEPKRTSQG